MRILYFSRDFTPHDHRFLSSLAKTDHQIFYFKAGKRKSSIGGPQCSGRRRSSTMGWWQRTLSMENDINNLKRIKAGNS